MKATENVLFPLITPADLVAEIFELIAANIGQVFIAQEWENETFAQFRQWQSLTGS
ncbi:MAG TPA: hypothetical protein PLY78_10595 [Methanospirillum sp.]|nr:hypothetical protein [Methanospirillum sp.]